MTDIQDTASIRDWDTVARDALRTPSSSRRYFYMTPFGDAYYIEFYQTESSLRSSFYFPWAKVNGVPKQVIAAGEVAGSQLRQKMRDGFLDRHGNLRFLTDEEKSNAVLYLLPDEVADANPNLSHHWWRYQTGDDLSWHKPDLTAYYKAKLDAELDYDAPAVNMLASAQRILKCNDIRTEGVAAKLHEARYDRLTDDPEELPRVGDAADLTEVRTAVQRQDTLLRAIAAVVCGIAGELTDPALRAKLDDDIALAAKHDEFVAEMNRQIALPRDEGASYEDIREDAIATVRAARNAASGGFPSAETVPENPFDYGDPPAEGGEEGSGDE